MFYGLLSNTPTGTPTSPASTKADPRKKGLELVTDMEPRQWPACLTTGGQNSLSVVVPTSSDPACWTIALSYTGPEGADDPTTTAHTLTVQHLTTLPHSQQLRRAVSLHGWMVRSRWGGVLFKAFLDSLPPAFRNARVVEQVGAQGERRWVNVRTLLEGEALLTYLESDLPITPWHGGPVRLGVFHKAWELGVNQLVALNFHAQPPQGVTIDEDPYAIPVGKWYAFDLKNFRPIERAREITAF